MGERDLTKGCEAFIVDNEKAAVLVDKRKIRSRWVCMIESNGPASWFALSEVDFCQRLEAVMAETGNPGDAFPPMVSYNVPWFLLRELWPARYALQSQRPCWMAFCAAEEGWRGRLDNVRSEAMPVSSGYSIRFAKTYVMTADLYLMLLRAEQGPALALVPRSSDWSWQERTEQGLHLRGSDGREVSHSRVSGEALIAAEQLLQPARRAYTRVGMLIPRREITSMAFMALGKRRHLGMVTATDGHTLGDSEDRSTVLAGRAAGRLGGMETVAATRILDRFFEDTRHAALEPFWQVIADFRKLVGRSQ